jgi:dephospho-CoA kinase
MTRLVVGLTGGIASGKSAVACEFAKLGIDIIDTDVIARQLVEPDQEAYKAIVAYFGDDILQKDGQLDRQTLRERIFADSEAKQWLEQLLHPCIRAATKDAINAASSAYCMVVIPLLVETLPNPLLQRVLVVDCDETVQLKRLLARDNIDTNLAKKMIAQQASRAARLEIADDIVENNGDLAQLKQAVKSLDAKYLHETC